MKKEANIDFEKKQITLEEQKKLLTEMLLYIDEVCRKNNINYSLIGGSLIGAIRHKGFIPWDDDIDIILDYENYKRLLKELKKEENSNYATLIPGETKDYPLQFAKLINLNTTLSEKNVISNINDNYGLFVDIFAYNYVPNDDSERKKYYKKFHFYQRILTKMKPNNKKNILQNIRRIIKNIYITIFGYKRNLKRILELFEKYSDSPTEYVMSNNPAYGYEKEIQKSSNIREYTNATFEGSNVMIFKKYDEILKTTFGNYMKLPPIEQRRTHGTEVYWKKR